jgi:osmoprotectant transport system permease protein
MEIGLMYQALRDGEVDVISGFSTDGRIKGYNLKLLEDDKHYFPPYDAAPLVRLDVLRRYPELEQVFTRMKNLISNQEMIDMNYLADHEKQSPEQIARNFLKEKGLKADESNNRGPVVSIGSKNFTESFILAQIFRIMIENYTNLSVDLKLGFGGTKLLFGALENGDLDLYPEYTGTGFLVILQPEEETRKYYIRNQNALWSFLQQEFGERYQLTWMPQLGFNNTFALMMRMDQAGNLKVNSLSDLAAYQQEMNQ